MNMNYLFNVEYYKKCQKIKSCNDQIVSQKYELSDNAIAFVKHSFLLETIYPGLLIGLGYPHDVDAAFFEGNAKDEEKINLGFTLDYVTGLPVIPGSTVKGVLRSAFDDYPQCAGAAFREQAEKLQKQGEEFKKQAAELGKRAEELQAKSKKMQEQPEKLQAKKEWDIFDQGKVIFFDAIPVKSGKDGRLFALENITPHKAKKSEYDGLTNPIPLTLLKVIPEVGYLFRFGFGRWDDTGISPDDLLQVFKTILLDLGIGAKTNVGFGALKEAEKQNGKTGENVFRCLAPCEPEASQPEEQKIQGSKQTGTKGKCNRCGKKTGKRANGEYYKYCQACFSAMQKIK